MRVWKTAVVGAAVAVAAAVAVPGTAGAAASCPRGWGSLPESGSANAPGSASAADALIGVRAGAHPCFDRVVLDVSGRGAGRYDVRYVRHVLADGSGTVVPLRGAADLQMILRAPSYDINTGRSTFSPARPSELVVTSGMRTLRQVADAGSFEGQTTIGVGVRARLPFRVTVLSGPGTGSRLVLDIAHTW